MPYKSEAQRKFFNSEAGKEKIGEAEVEHWNKESEGMDLPEKVKDMLDKAIKTCDEKSLLQVYNDGMRAMSSAMDIKNPEKSRTEIDKIFMDTIDEMNDVINEMNRQLSKFRSSLFSKKQEINKTLFAAYRNMNK